MTGSRNSGWVENLDWRSIFLYLALVVVGWFAIYSANYTEEGSFVFDFSRRHGMQVIWTGVGLFVGVVLLLVDDRYYHMLAYPAYWISVVLLLFTLFFGREINGAKAWIFIGQNAIQPAEFVKYTTSLAIARFMSRDVFNIHSWPELIKLGLLLFIPSLIIILQNDTGSAVVFASFLIVFYREGLSGWICLAVIMAVVLFVLSLLFSLPLPLLLFWFEDVKKVVIGGWKRRRLVVSAVTLRGVQRDIFFFSSKECGEDQIGSVI